ncbi:MAG: phosphoglucosamine mutase [Oscillospiraceae bacterium]|nr:phosphoglucosamine mutase [Oscillospiraceae bacterium]
MGEYFGTDGIRGIVNAEMDSGLAFKTGQAAAMVLSEGIGGGRPVFAIGKDTRISGDMLEAALIAGLCTAGADVLRLGIVPTPAVAFITRESGTDSGIVISASHNPFEYNGIKIFDSKGFKLSDEIESKIEELLKHEERLVNKTGREVGRVLGNNNDYTERYIAHVIKSAEAPIKGLKVLMDCANGAAAVTASRIFGKFPIEVDFIKEHPDGVNINNKCGSTDLRLLRKLTAAGDFDIGLAFDGDADRCLAADENGNIIDGDKIMAICGVDMKNKGILKHNSIVVTIMSNMGFQKYLENEGIKILRTTVGDKYVLEKMLEGGYNLGGEQSGHIIFSDDSVTGDGQLAAVKLLSALSSFGGKASEMVSEIREYPQILENVTIPGGNEAKEALMSDPELLGAIAREESRLGEKGRILVRPSGTEAVIRIMVEAEDEPDVISCAKYLTKVIKSRSKPQIN